MSVSALVAFVLATVDNPILSTTTGELAVPVASQPVGATLRKIQEALAHITGVRVLAVASLAAVPPETQALLDKTPLRFGSDLECCVLVCADGAVTTLRMCPTERVLKAYTAFSQNKDNPEAAKYVRFQLLHKLRVNPQILESSLTNPDTGVRHTTTRERYILTCSPVGAALLLGPRRNSL